MSYPTVHITEEVMREGMQIESVEISVDDKVRLLDALSETGLRRIVVGSFVRAEYTPQMARIDEIVQRFRPEVGVTYLALALNERGRQRAAAFAPPLTMEPMPPVLFTNMCSTFALRNTARSQQQEIASWPAIVSAAIDSGKQEAALGLGAAFGSNFEGEFTSEERMDLLRRQHGTWTEAGIPVTSVFLADSMGWVKPWVIEEQIALIRGEWPGITHWYLHLHNSRGLALASTYEAIRILDDRHDLHLDSTLGGIGGCPYCGNGRATGLVPTEDLVNMLEELGIGTGIALDQLIRAVWMLEEIIGAPAFGHVSKAGPHPHGDALYDPNLPFVETLEEARHFLLGPDAVAHQIRPWREPIPQRALPPSAR